MARHEVFQLSERKDAEHEEERAGLLEDAEHSESSSDVSGVEELGTKGDFEGRPSESTVQRARRNWLR
jgi:hypothetical protein